jgi:hypothetical protein
MADRKQRSIRPGQQGASTRPGSLLDAVPLDIMAAVPTGDSHGRVTVRVEGLLNGGRLTKGQNNGDRTWSLNVEELDGLKYVPPYGGFTSHTLWIRVLAMDEGLANTLSVFALEVDPDALPPRLHNSEAENKLSAAGSKGVRNAKAEAPAPDPSKLKAQIEAEAERRAAEAQKKSAADAARELKDARAAWQEEADRKLADARAAWQKETAQKLADAKAEAEAAMLRQIKADSGAKAADQASQAQRIAELEKRLHAAESKAGSAETISDLEAQLQNAQKAAAEKDKLAATVQELQDHLKNAAKVWEKAEARALAAEKASQAADGKLVDALAQLARADEEVKRAERSANSAAEGQVKRLTAELAAKEKEHEAALKAVRKETKDAVDADYVEALEALRKQHEDELSKRIAQEREKVTKEYEERMAELQATLENAAERRVGAVEKSIQDAVADACAKAVSDAQAEWQSEHEQSLAQASEAWKRDLDQRLAAARIEWEGERQEAQQAAEAEWRGQMETALAAAAAEAERAREAAVAERDGSWQAEIERRIEEVRSQSTGDVDERLEVARAAWERQHEAALIERDDAWRDHIETKLKEAHAEWRAEEDRRFAAAREEWHQSARDAFAQQGGTTPAAPHAPESQAAADSGYPHLTLQDRLPEPGIAPAPSRRGVRKGATVLRSLYRATLGRLPVRGMVRTAVVLVLLAGGVLAYPYMAPVFTQKIVPITSDIAGKVQGFGERLFAPSNVPQEKVSPLVGTRKFIRPSSANLRVTPTANADVVGVAERASVVEILTVRGDWYEVRTIGRFPKQGWIHRSLLAEKPFS